MSIKQIEGGRAWTESTIAVKGWDSDCHNFRIIPAKNGRGFILIAFDHEGDDGDIWNRVFQTLEGAMEYAERM